MKIITTPMCKEILRLAGISDFILSAQPDSADADLAVVLSETETTIKSIKIRLNTFSQIIESIKLLSDIFGTETPESFNHVFEKIKKEKIKISKMYNENQKIKVKVYSNFLGDIVKDMGFKVVDNVDEDYDFVVYPDYMENGIDNRIKSKIKDKKAVKMPSHKNVPVNPIARAELRYKILERQLCMRR